MDDVQKVKQKIDIVELIESYIPLKKAGRNFKTQCPFHSEKSASFVVSPDRQIWHCFGCFPPGQKIKTPFGYHNIEELDVEHYVVSGKGNIKKITETMVHQYKGDLVQIRIRKLDGRVKLTADHNVYVIRGADYLHTQYKNFSRRYVSYIKLREKNAGKYYEKINKYLPLKKLPAGELKLGDLLLFPIRRLEKDIEVIDLSIYISKKTNYGPVPKKIPFDIPVNEDLLKLIGYYVAEGSNHRAYIRFSLGNHEEEFAQEIVLLIKKIFGLDARIHRRSTLEKTGIEITASHSKLANIFENLCGKGSSNKHIPFVFQDLPTKKQRVILEAIHRGDGTSFLANKSKKIHKSITTVSRVLSEQLVDFLLRQNIFPTLADRDARIDRAGVNHLDSYTVFWSEEAKQKYSLIYYQPDGSEYWMLPIVELEREQYEGPVHNFTVEDDNSYVATNFAVANCQKGGDVFTFVEEYEHTTFSDALKFLASKAGIKLTTSAARTEQDRKRDLLYTLNSLAAQYYEYILFSHNVGKSALNYAIHERHQPEALLKTFQVGYAPNTGTSLVKFLLSKKKYQAQDLIDAGLAFRQGTRIVDFFRHRIMFPITDPRGNIIAFSGRALDAMQMPKYVNTKETVLYKKGETVFGLNLARDAIKKEGSVIIMEGEFDVISAHREGIGNVVAVKGTALTQEQIELLRRYSQKLVFCFDTDPAGTAAQRRSIQLIENAGIVASVIVLPRGKDPDELLSSDPVAFKQALKKDVHIYDFIIDSAVRENDPASADGKRAILEKTISFLSVIDNEVIKEHYLKKLADALDTSLESVTRQAEKDKGQKENKFAKTQTPKKTREEMISQYLFSVILQSSNTLEALREADTIIGSIPLLSPVYERLFKLLKQELEQGNTLEAFVKTLPAELTEAYDTAYIAPIPEFDEKGLAEELRKTATEEKLFAIKKRLSQITQEMVQLEKEHKEEEVLELQKEAQFLTSKMTNASA